MSYIQKGTVAFRNANVALFFGGFTTFAIMYSTQPFLPEFSREFHISPAVASMGIAMGLYISENSVGGTFWSTFGWAGVISIILVFLLLALFLSLRLNSIAPSSNP
jgi:hypothetical protein